MHLFSRPDDYRSYLTRMDDCQVKHPQRKTYGPMDDAIMEGFIGDSIKGMPLRLSVVGRSFHSMVPWGMIFWK